MRAMRTERGSLSLQVNAHCIIYICGADGNKSSCLPADTADLTTYLPLSVPVHIFTLMSSLPGPVSHARMVYHGLRHGSAHRVDLSKTRRNRTLSLNSSERLSTPKSFHKSAHKLNSFSKGKPRLTPHIGRQESCPSPSPTDLSNIRTSQTSQPGLARRA